MLKPSPPLIKVCGLTRQQDLALVEEYGFAYAGFIFAAQSPRNITPAHAASLHSHKIKRVGVFTTTPPDTILAIMQQANLHYAQLHGPYTPEQCQDIGKNQTIKVLWPEQYPTPQAMQDDINRFAATVSLFVLDAGKQGSGGTGTPFNWDCIRTMHSPCPVLLAGGIGPGNLMQAWSAHKHCIQGFDLNSAVESSPGCKDPALLQQVFSIITSYTAQQVQGSTP